MINTVPRKPIVLVFVNYYLPGYRGGGPIRSIANMVDRLGDEFDFRIVTMDRDVGDQCAYPSIDVNKWNQVGRAQVFYTSSASRTLWRIAGFIREIPHDVLYLNSFFDNVFTIRPLLAIALKLAQLTPIIMAPRGEFSEGALNIKSWKKKPYIKFVAGFNLLKNVIWHASTNYEKKDIEKAMTPKAGGDWGKLSVIVAPDLMPVFNDFIKLRTNVHVAKTSTLNICFLSRITPVKNLDFAIRILAKVKVPVDFQIFGPKESDAYWKLCETLIDKLPTHIKVKYCGSVENTQVCSTIALYDIFFLPTHGENFGHVFVEAFSAGVPVLISDQTPWRNLKEQQLGWDISLDDPDAFVAAIEEAATFNAAKRADMRERCMDFARKIAEDMGNIELNRNLFLQAIALNKTAAINEAT